MAELDPRYIAKARQTVYAQFPEMRGVEPTLATRAVPGAPPRSIYVLTFKQQVTLSGSESLNRLVRVTLNQDGAIVKIASSR